MMKFWYSKYLLQPQTSLGTLADAHPREGALLLIEWPDKKVGYADLFPWPELGDETLEVHLNKLRSGHLTRLVEQSIWLARRDALMRSKKINVWSMGLGKVKNHFLVNDCTRIDETTIQDAILASFSTFKVKTGKSPEEELRWIDRFMRQRKNLQLRLDFNCSLSLPEYKEYMKGVHPSFRSRIEFVEDPMRFDPDNWREVMALAPLALDQEFDRVDWKQLKDSAPFEVLIFKPARQDAKLVLEKMNKYALKMAITSSMDHPVGVAHAAWLANETKKFSPNTLLDCGCLSLRSYKTSDFSLMVLQQGPYVNEVPGTGIGFDLLLGKLPWTLIEKTT